MYESAAECNLRGRVNYRTLEDRRQLNTWSCRQELLRVAEGPTCSPVLVGSEPAPPYRWASRWSARWRAGSPRPRPPCGQLARHHLHCETESSLKTNHLWACNLRVPRACHQCGTNPPSMQGLSSQSWQHQERTVTLRLFLLDLLLSPQVIPVRYESARLRLPPVRPLKHTGLKAVGNGRCT